MAAVSLFQFAGKYSRLEYDILYDPEYEVLHLWFASAPEYRSAARKDQPWRCVWTRALAPNASAAHAALLWMQYLLWEIDYNQFHKSPLFVPD